MNVPWVGNLEEPATSSCSSEYLPDALKWMESAHCVQSPAYTAETVTLVTLKKGKITMVFQFHQTILDHLKMLKYCPDVHK